uniref:Transposase n=1 Tax=Prevotella sp. GTC17259 TaxID=3236795 RepID=A0AB33J4U8_9BACT
MKVDKWTSGQVNKLEIVLAYGECLFTSGQKEKSKCSKLIGFQVFSTIARDCYLKLDKYTAKITDLWNKMRNFVIQ